MRVNLMSLQMLGISPWMGSVWHTTGKSIWCPFGALWNQGDMQREPWMYHHFLQVLFHPSSRTTVPRAQLWHLEIVPYCDDFPVQEDHSQWHTWHTVRGCSLQQNRNSWNQFETLYFLDLQELELPCVSFQSVDPLFIIPIIHHTNGEVLGEVSNVTLPQSVAEPFFYKQ